MKAITLPILLVFSMVTAQGTYASDLTPEIQKPVDPAIKSSDLKQAEPSCNIQSEPVLEEDTLEHAKVLMQDGVNLIGHGQSEKGNEETSRAFEIISNYIKKKKNGQLTDSELDLRAAALRIHEQVIDGPCNDMAELQRRIKRAWFPPCCTGQSSQIQVQFRLHKNGKISELHITKSGACASSNQAALNAVHNAAPFYPLPLAAPPSVLIQFTFDYNLFSNRESGATKATIWPGPVLMVPACN